MLKANIVYVRREDTHVSQFQEHDGGWSSVTEKNGEKVTGDEIYLMGIIDFLQFYNRRKRAETFIKGFKHNRNEISAVMQPPFVLWTTHQLQTPWWPLPSRCSIHSLSSFPKFLRQRQIHKLSDFTFGPLHLLDVLPLCLELQVHPKLYASRFVAYMDSIMA